MTCRPGLAPVAALAILAFSGLAQAQHAEPLDRAWEQALVDAGQVAEPIEPRLRHLAEEGLVIDPDAPGIRTAVDAALAQRGIPEGHRALVLDALMREVRVSLSSARVVGIGPLEMTRADVAMIAGPRQGRDRAQVVARMRARVPGATLLSDEEATALVPPIVRMADQAGSSAALERFLGEIRGRGSAE